jgi:hypothetical protein
VDVVHRERVPAVLPRPARAGIAVEHDVLDAPPLQRIGRRQATLTGSDDEGIVDHAHENAADRAVMPSPAALITAG